MDTAAVAQPLERIAPPEAWTLSESATKLKQAHVTILQPRLSLPAGRLRRWNILPLLPESQRSLPFQW